MGDEHANWDYIQEIGEGEALKTVIDEYKRYKNYNQPWTSYFSTSNWEAAFSEMLNDALAIEDNFPSLQRVKELFAADNEERMREELHSEGLEEFGKMYINEPFATEEQAEEYIEKHRESFDLTDYVYGMGIENFTYALNNAGVSLESFLIELNQNLVFPLWHRYWTDQGIEKTRENIEEIYRNLTAGGDLKTQVTNINIALHTAHQNGDMIDYLEQYNPEVDSYGAKDLLDDLSSNKFIAEWNKQLEKIGIVIPEKIKEDVEYSIQNELV